jgi:hypothetical protein
VKITWHLRQDKTYSLPYFENNLASLGSISQTFLQTLSWIKRLGNLEPGSNALAYYKSWTIKAHRVQTH